MDRLPVSSSAFLSIGYDRSERKLEVEFADETVYEYDDVPPGVYNRWMAAPSMGRFFSDEVRGVYPCRPVS